LRTEKVDDSETPDDEIDRDFAVLAVLCSEIDSADELQLQQALHDAHRQSKEQVRRDLGLTYCRALCSIAITFRLRCARSRRCADALRSDRRPGF
jgi:hypothetical protein